MLRRFFVLGRKSTDFLPRLAEQRGWLDARRVHQPLGDIVEAKVFVGGPEPVRGDFCKVPETFFVLAQYPRAFAGLRKSDTLISQRQAEQPTGHRGEQKQKQREPDSDHLDGGAGRDLEHEDFAMLCDRYLVDERVKDPKCSAPHWRGALED